MTTPEGEDANFYGERNMADISVVCEITKFGYQLQPTGPGMKAKETKKYHIILCNVLWYPKECCPLTLNSYELRDYQKAVASLAM